MNGTIRRGFLGEAQSVFAAAPATGEAPQAPAGGGNTLNELCPLLNNGKSAHKKIGRLCRKRFIMMLPAL
jgi:hypothetical protein